MTPCDKVIAVEQDRTHLKKYLKHFWEMKLSPSAFREGFPEPPPAFLWTPGFVVGHSSAKPHRADLV